MAKPQDKTPGTTTGTDAPAPAKLTSAQIDQTDRVNELALKLDALLCCTCGEAGDSFRNMSDGIQDRFLWAASDIARELVIALGLADLPGVDYAQ